MYGGEALLGLIGNESFELIHGDLRDGDRARMALKGVDAVAHLAAIVGDPACSRDPDLARSINLEGSKALYTLAGEEGVKRFVFASTCSNYGRMSGDGFVTEESPLNPISIYAETKVEFERYLLGQPHDAGCVPVCLRFSTVYGLSPRVRFDLTVNEFTRELVLGRELVIFGEQFWRPYCHVRDLSRSVVAALEADREAVGFDVFNVGDTDENYQKKMIVDRLLEQIPDGKVRTVHKDEDPRDYRVDFSKIRKHLGFTITLRVPDGIREIVDILRMGLLQDPDSPRYSNT